MPPDRTYRVAPPSIEVQDPYSAVRPEDLADAIFTIAETSPCNTKTASSNSIHHVKPAKNVECRRPSNLLTASIDTNTIASSSSSVSSSLSVTATAAGSKGLLQSDPAGNPKGALRVTSGMSRANSNEYGISNKGMLPSLSKEIRGLSITSRNVSKFRSPDVSAIQSARFRQQQLPAETPHASQIPSFLGKELALLDVKPQPDRELTDIGESQEKMLDKISVPAVDRARAKSLKCDANINAPCTSTNVKTLNLKTSSTTISLSKGPAKLPLASSSSSSSSSRGPTMTLLKKLGNIGKSRLPRNPCSAETSANDIIPSLPHLPTTHKEHVAIAKSMPKRGLAGSSSTPEVKLKTTYQLSDFELREQIGKGAFARVFLVKFVINVGTAPLRRGHGMYFALKVLSKKLIVDTRQVKHVMNEKNLLELTKSPFVVSLIATFTDPRHLFLVMEYVPGGDLFSYLRKSIEYLHALKIVYRDLKPENILLDSKGHLKLADFGFAKIAQDVTKTFCGTPAYMAPEIILKLPYTQAVDWWSFGIVTYEMMAGYTPYHDTSPQKIYENVLSGKFRWSSQIQPTAKEFLKKLLDPMPKRRLGSSGMGSREVKENPWFDTVDWGAVARRDLPTPWNPPVKSDGDPTNFEIYKDESSIVEASKGVMPVAPADGLYDDAFLGF
ncbi:hypothetical protein SeMB42_g07331 [Synchytrium endobioticum]|uniref:cAMP-dependent protein kinase n=2 Tax=Synchytrium endobioticum TaxID=286115 RepID=A0A507BYN9_9FUNG|nr:hypothetical protein SeMB42_g07331 [Synchytrium endobioticum]